MFCFHFHMLTIPWLKQTTKWIMNEVLWSLKLSIVTASAFIWRVSSDLGHSVISSTGETFVMSRLIIFSFINEMPHWLLQTSKLHVQGFLVTHLAKVRSPCREVTLLCSLTGYTVNVCFFFFVTNYKCQVGIYLASLDAACLPLPAVK